MQPHVFTATEETGLEALVRTYGSRLERLSDNHKLFIMGTLALYLYGSHSAQGAIDELDPDAQFLSSFTELVERLEKTDRHDLLLLVATIANELAWHPHNRKV